MLRNARVPVWVCAMLALCVVGTAYAQPADYRTFFTFSQPVQLPGVTLAAGKYIFRLGDPNSGRKVIQVLSADNKMIYATLLAIPNQRLEAPADPEVRFMEAPAGVAHPVKTWWYPGNSTGWEFIYPREQALRIAKVANEPVLTTAKQTSSEEEFRAADLTRVEPSGSDSRVTADANPAPSAPRGTVERGQIAERSQTTAQAPSRTASEDRPEPTATSGRDTLPATASTMPTVALVGLFALFSGLGLRMWRRSVRA